MGRGWRHLVGSVAIAAGCLAVLGSSSAGSPAGSVRQPSLADPPAVMLLANRPARAAIDPVAVLTEGPGSVVIAVARRGSPDGAANRLPVASAMLSSLCVVGLLACGRLGQRTSREVVRSRLCVPYGVRAPPRSAFA